MKETLGNISWLHLNLEFLPLMSSHPLIFFFHFATLILCMQQSNIMMLSLKLHKEVLPLITYAPYLHFPILL